MLARKINKSQRKAGLIIGLSPFLAIFDVQSALNRPVSDDGKPTGIDVVGAVLDVDKIDSAEQRFTLIFMRCSAGLTRVLHMKKMAA